ncbi:hypothetical protein GIB67_037709 [Kingdonia uniflora]|uniref:Ubiquitin-like protease family profile domain-containing protein n=1 Tax=Kingdonia uniflora TaxID=39325 RepID=A0A7J7P169_9MAGN|nr:hypothetical protein GIB67_037709 [Kingdonia uniflora]
MLLSNSFNKFTAILFYGISKVYAEFEVYGGSLNLTGCCLYGGAPYHSQETSLKRGVDIVIGTPGRIRASVDQITVVFVEEQTIDVAQTEVVISHQEEDVGEASQQTKEKLVSPLKIHRKPNSKKKEDLEMGDPNERLTVLETIVSALTSTVGELVEQLRLTNLAKAATSVKRQCRSKKKVVMEVDGDENVPIFDDSKSIRRELKLFTVANIEDTTVKAIAIVGKYLKSDKEDDKIKSGYKSSWKNEHKGDAKGEGSSSKEFHYNHCKASGHLSNYCWKFHPELRPKGEKRNKKKYVLVAEVIDVYIKALIQYFDTQHRARPDKEKIVPADVFAGQYIYREFNVWTRNMSSPEGNKKLSPGHQLIEDHISTILPKMLIWSDFFDRISPPTGSEVYDYGLNFKWTTRFGKCPIQPNGYHCGVYMFVFMDNLLRGMKFLDLIDGNEYRYTIAYDILRLGVEPEEILKL